MLIIMAFRHSINRPRYSAPCPVVDIVLKHDIVDGVDIVTPVEVDASTLINNVPLPSDYKLSALIAAGVPLTPVDPLLYNDEQSQVSKVINDIVSSDSSSDTDVSDDTLDSSNS